MNEKPTLKLMYRDPILNADELSEESYLLHVTHEITVIAEAIPIDTHCSLCQQPERMFKVEVMEIKRLIDSVMIDTDDTAALPFVTYAEKVCCHEEVWCSNQACKRSGSLEIMRRMESKGLIS